MTKTGGRAVCWEQCAFQYTHQLSDINTDYPLQEIVPLRYYFTTTAPLRLVQTARGAYRIDLSILAGFRPQFIHLLYYQINAEKPSNFRVGIDAYYLLMD